MWNYGNRKMMQEYGMAYHIYGIYNDWKIDHNLFPEWGVEDPHGIDMFEDMYEENYWQVAKVQISGKELLIIDVDLKYFSYCAMTGLEPTVIANNLPGKNILMRLKEQSDVTGLAVLDQINFYLGAV